MTDQTLIVLMLALFVAFMALLAYKYVLHYKMLRQMGHNLKGYMDIFRLRPSALIWYWCPLYYVLKEVQPQTTDAQQTEKQLKIVSTLWLIVTGVLWMLISKVSEQ